jgi:hypothetical protein
MSGSLFQFGEQVPGQAVPVLNERAVRAGAGLLFLFAMIAFMNAWLTGNFAPTRVFVVAFLIDFALRLIRPSDAAALAAGARRTGIPRLGCGRRAGAGGVDFAVPRSFSRARAGSIGRQRPGRTLPGAGVRQGDRA